MSVIHFGRTKTCLSRLPSSAPREPWAASSCSFWKNAISRTRRSNFSRRAGRRASRFASRECSIRSEEQTSELQSLRHLVCRLLLEKRKKKRQTVDDGLAGNQKRIDRANQTG